MDCAIIYDFFIVVAGITTMLAITFRQFRDFRESYKRYIWFHVGMPLIAVSMMRVTNQHFLSGEPQDVLRFCAQIFLLTFFVHFLPYCAGVVVQPVSFELQQPDSDMDSGGKNDASPDDASESFGDTIQRR